MAGAVSSWVFLSQLRNLTLTSTEETRMSESRDRSSSSQI
jgi:hypothetical protein